MNKKLVLIVLLTFSYTISFSQIKGVVIDNNNPIEYATVAIYSLPDSVLITGTVTDKLGMFSIESVSLENTFLKVSMVGFENVYLKTADNLRIKMSERNIHLQDVVITANPLFFLNNNGNLLVNIKNTFLSNSIDTKEILNMLPGVVISAQGGISMFDRDNLVIYINEHKVASQEQIRSIQPADIYSTPT